MRRSGLSIQDNNSGESVVVNTDIMKGPVIIGLMPTHLPLHVVPIDDSQPHDSMHFLDCACEPNLQLNGSRFTVVHNAYDGRA